MDRRLELQEMLEMILGSTEVYFQAPSNIAMKYPAIIYERDYMWVAHSGNLPYASKKRYLVTIIDRDADSLFPDQIAALPLSQFSRHFVTDNLHHDVYTLYF